MFESNNLFRVAYQVLKADSVEEKVKLSYEGYRQWRSNKLTRNKEECCPSITACGIPALPKLVDHKDLPKRSLATLPGQAALVHAIAHIEFNAINLAWDAIYRYRHLPNDYYNDWLKVANEETKHFELLNARLQELNYRYGDFDAHAGLWHMAEKTADNFMHRMAVIPRAMEARGLDVTPGLIKRLHQIGDLRTVEILELILEEEIGHVAIGDRWFRYACEKAACKPEAMYRQIVTQYNSSSMQGPFNIQARIQAGFSRVELENLANYQARKPSEK